MACSRHMVCASKLLEGVFTFGKTYEDNTSDHFPVLSLVPDTGGEPIEISRSYFMDATTFQLNSESLVEQKDHRILDIIMEKDTIFV